MYNIEWQDINEDRKYPFISTATLKDKTNTFTLSNSFFLDAIILVNKDFQAQFYVDQIKYTPDLISISINMQDGTPALIGTSENPTDFSTLGLEGKNEYLGSFGKLMLGKISNIPYGTLSFYAPATMFEPCKILKLNSGISSINGITSGNVILSSESNVIIRVEGNKIYINSIDGLCACNETPCIKTINGIEPINSNFIINGIGCVKVSDDEGGIIVENTCEESCCGCDEVNDFIDRMQGLENRIHALESP